MNDDNERWFRSAFARLRQEEEAALPEFTALTSPKGMGAPAVARLGRRRVLALTAAAAAIGALAFGALHRPDRNPYPIDLATTKWQGPTDFLLAVSVDPGLSTVPPIGTTDLPWRSQ